jgi:glutathione S-transferase
MKLYQTYLSPFPTRVRLLLYAKGLDVELVEPPGFHGDARGKGAYLEKNPIGRIPALELDNGTVIPESEVICEYLEDEFPEPSLRPRDPVERARVRLLSRISDFYLVMAMAPLFDTVALPPKQWDQERVRRALGEIAAALRHVEAYIGTQGYAVGKSLTQADGVLLPMLLLVDEWLPIFRPPEPLLDRVPKTRAYWRTLARDPVCARLIEETRTALRNSMQRA